MRPIDLFWWQHSDSKIHNVGDELNPLIVEIISGRKVRRRPIDECDMVAIGSIMEIAVQAERQRPLHVWGTGFIKNGQSVTGNFQCAALRGPNSARRVTGGECASVGDPGLFADLLIAKRSSAKKGIGVIPHYVDLDRPLIAAMRSSNGHHRVISPLLPPVEFVAAIAECAVVMSSSLHGLVVADSLRIPNRWIEMSNAIVGDGYKFRDYLAVFGVDAIEPLKLETAEQINDALVDEIGANYARPNLDEIRDMLAASFPVID